MENWEKYIFPCFSLSRLGLYTFKGDCVLVNMTLVAVVVRKTGKTGSQAEHCRGYGLLQPSRPIFFLLLLGLPWHSHMPISGLEGSVIWKTWLQCPFAGWLQGCLHGSCRWWARGCRGPSGVAEGVTWQFFLGGIMLLEPAYFCWARANRALRFPVGKTWIIRMLMKCI